MNTRTTTAIRLAPEEREAFTTRAESLGMSLSAYLRWLACLDTGLEKSRTRKVRVTLPRDG